MDETPSGITPRDDRSVARVRGRRRRRKVVIGVVLALVAAVGVGQLAFGVLSRVIDATGWTCGSGWQRIDDDELTDMRIVRWGTPAAREQGFDPDDFTDLPPGLAEPTLTTAADPTAGEYDPLLYPLDGAVVLQADGYVDNTWVGADARTGEPLWGFTSSTSGFSSVQGYATLVSARDDGRTDLTTFDARTGEELACARLGGEVLDIDGVGERDLLVALHGAADDTYRLVRLDPISGEVAWDEPLSVYPARVEAGPEQIVVSSRQVGAIVTQWGDSVGVPTVVGIDAASGEQAWERTSAQGQMAVIGAAPLPGGEIGALALDISDRQAWDEATGEYVLLDGRGQELWRAPAAYGRDDLSSWTVDGVAVVLEDFRPIALDLSTGERLWEAEGSALEDDVGVLGGHVVLTDQRADGEDGKTRVVTYVIDAHTGDFTVVDAPLRSFRVTDSYVLSTTGQTQIIIPLLDS